MINQTMPETTRIPIEYLPISAIILLSIIILGLFVMFIIDYLKRKKSKEICEYCGKEMSKHKVRPEYLKRLKKIEKEGYVGKVSNSINELLQEIES